MRDAFSESEACAREAEISAAARTGEWTESSRAHAGECAFCQDVVRASRWMQGFAGTLAQDADIDVLPDPHVVWWRARMADKQREAERAHKRLAWFEIAVGAAISLGLASWLALDRTVLPAATAWVLNDGASSFWTAVNSIDILTPVVFSSVAVDVSLLAISFAVFALARD